MSKQLIGPFILSLSFVAWYGFCPDGYLPYFHQLLGRLRYPEVWRNSQEDYANRVVRPLLEQFSVLAEQGRRGPAPADVGHWAGDDPSTSPWQRIQARYISRGLHVEPVPSYWGEDRPQAEAFARTLFAENPSLLPDLFAALDRNVSANPAVGEPQLCWTYIILRDPDLIVYWPGGSQYQRYRDRESPSLMPSSAEVRDAWLDDVLSRQWSFEPTSGDSLGAGETMILGRRIWLHGRPALLAADVEWQHSRLSAVTLSVLAYSTWFYVTMLGTLLLIGRAIERRASRRREGTGVAVTIDIVSWSTLRSVDDRFRMQQMLDDCIEQTLLDTTGDSSLRWFTGDGFHVLFSTSWGHAIYSAPFDFVREMLCDWSRRMGCESSSFARTLRVSIGSHGPVKTIREADGWRAIGDRLVSAVRVDEVSRTARPAGDAELVVACAAAFEREAELHLGRRYTELIRPLADSERRVDKAGQLHEFRWLRVHPLVEVDSRQ